MMKITFLLPYVNDLAGGLRVVAQHAQYLLNEGHSVTLVGQKKMRPTGLRATLRRLMRREPPFQEIEGQDHFSSRGLDVVLFPTDHVLGPEDLPDADVIVATWWQTVEAFRNLPPEKGVQAHFIQDHEVFPNLPRDRVEAVYRRPTHKIVVASWLERVMRENYDQPAHLAVNGVDTTVFRMPERHRGHPPCMGFLNTRTPRKNIELAVAAMEAARRRRPDLRCIAFGSHPASELPDWIEFEQRPSQSRIPEIYGACDAWLFPSITEGFGLPILEAMSCGTPVLAARAGAAEDLVTRENGRLLERDPEIFAEAILEMAGMDDANWTAMSRAARRTAEAHDLAPASARFEAVLTEIAATPRG
ncbi:glycosyltransferase family 4 protein [Palleronia sp. LCG004]|uniref:glycosyltransferase family 4 protein n=1 Tax=Palleronia sp. LCG004 TaxID=3079304 RepID=UPI002941EEEE|nr:glycosyltransferase family 4 protein [Palleronia sp. LCG004]WOI58393.1 glycosyltransferase family 4 protein [Palleronia sp. LCG004]